MCVCARLFVCLCAPICLWKGILPPSPMCDCTLTKSLCRANCDVTSFFCLPTPLTLSPSSASLLPYTHTHTPLPVSPEYLSAALSFRRITRQLAQCVANTDSWRAGNIGQHWYCMRHSQRHTQMELTTEIVQHWQRSRVCTSNVSKVTIVHTEEYTKNRSFNFNFLFLFCNLKKVL